MTVGGTLGLTASSHLPPEVMLQAVGVYDIVEGRMQAIANSATYPPKLPIFKNHNVSFPDRSWIVTPKGRLLPSRCSFIVDIITDSIKKNDYYKEFHWRQYQLNNVRAIQKREYVDVHLKVKLRSMRGTCTNVISSTIDGDLLRYDNFVLKTTQYAFIATVLSLCQLVLLYYQLQFSTPAIFGSKLSLASLAMHSVFDAYLCIVHLIMALYMDDLF